MKIIETLEKQEWRVTIPLVMILLAGIVTLFSAGLGTNEGFSLSQNSELTNQLTFIVLGVIFYFGFMFFDYVYLKYIPVQIIVGVGAFLPLIGVLLFGVTRNNATRWFDLGFATLQPSEFSKILLVVGFAFILTQLTKLPEWARAGLSIVVAMMMAALIFIQPNLSTALIVVAMGALMFLSQTKDQIFWLISFLCVVIYLLIYSGTMYLDIVPWLNIKIGEIKIDLLLLGIFIGINFIAAVLVPKYRIYAGITFIATLVFIAVAALSWTFVLRPYQKTRIESFFATEECTSANSQCFQVDQAKVAIGSGGLFGKGFGHGTQSKLNFLPEQHTDFIFAAFAEEFGLVGATLLIVMYLVLVTGVFSVAFKTQDPFATIICIGIGVMFLLEIFINISVNVDILPSTGVALPLMSLGGSSMWAKLIALGLVQSIAVNTDLSNKRVLYA